MHIHCTVVPTKSDRDVIFCLQLLNLANKRHVQSYTNGKEGFSQN